jgi:hypothetical protein
MQPRKLVVLVSAIALLHSTSTAQSRTTTTTHWALEKIIYHSGHCNGTCPAIDLEIDSNNNVLLKRDIWTAKGVTDKHHSGSFKGKIDPHTYFNLIATLLSSDYSNLTFPAIFCCDGEITTIIIYANGRRTKLSSMTPPKEAFRLIEFLQDLALKLNLPPTAEDIKLEQ